jgi:TldD protein
MIQQARRAMELIDLGPQVIKQALCRGGEFGELYIERRTFSTISCEDNKLNKIISGSEYGAGVRLIRNLKTAYAYTNRLERDALLGLALKVSQAVDNDDCHNGRVVIPELTLRDYFPRGVLLSSGADMVSKKVELVKYADELARRVDKRIRQVKVVCSELVQQVDIVNSEGLYCLDERLNSVFMVQVIAAAGNIIQTGYELRGGSRGFVINEVLVEEIANIAARRAVQMLDAKPAPAGTMTVLLSGKAGGTMVHEAIGHGLEADLAQNRLSVYSDCIGKQVASPAITVIDDGTIPHLRGSFNFDDEGVPARHNVLVDKGVLKGYMYDRLSAMKDNVSSTGNGRRQSYQHHPIPRMTNTLIAPGEDDPQHMLASVDRGLLITALGGGQVNTVNGDFVFEVNEGYLIERGEQTYPLRGATLTGNGPQILNQVQAVGNDLGFTVGTCGKDAQLCPCSDAQPSLLIPNIVVGGTA